jgi:hypothetical protein
MTCIPARSTRQEGAKKRKAINRGKKIHPGQAFQVVARSAKRGGYSGDVLRVFHKKRNSVWSKPEEMGDMPARMRLVSLKSVSSRASATMALSVGFPAATRVETMPDLEVQLHWNMSLWRGRLEKRNVPLV